MCGVWWNIKKSSDPNPGDDAGIKANYCFAVLRTSESDAQIRIKLQLLVDAGWKHIFPRTLDGVKVKVQKEEGSLILDPRTRYKAIVKVSVEIILASF
jgi:hypothetical protein